MAIGNQVVSPVVVRLPPASGGFLIRSAEQLLTIPLGFLTIALVTFLGSYFYANVGYEFYVGSLIGGVIGLLPAFIAVFEAEFSVTSPPGHGAYISQRVRAFAKDLGYSEEIAPGELSTRFSVRWPLLFCKINKISIVEGSGMVKVVGPWATIKPLRRKMLRNSSQSRSTTA